MDDDWNPMLRSPMQQTISSEIRSQRPNKFLHSQILAMGFLDSLPYALSLFLLAKVAQIVLEYLRSIHLVR